MNIQKTLKGLCKPSYIYFIISMIALVMMAIQNLGNTHTYVCGMYQCSVENTTAVFISKLLYVLFWTWLLNVFCKAGYEKLSWQSQQYLLKNPVTNNDIYLCFHVCR